MRKLYEEIRYIYIIYYFFRQPTTKRQYRKRDESWTPDKKSRLGRTDSYSRAVSTAQLTQEQQEMFDKFELPKPIDEFKMPPSKGINRKSHIGKQSFYITVFFLIRKKLLPIVHNVGYIVYMLLHLKLEFVS